MHVISVGTSFPRPSNMELAISVIRLKDECNICSAWVSSWDFRDRYPVGFPMVSWDDDIPIYEMEK